MAAERCKDLIGRLVVLTRDVKTGRDQFFKGEVFRIYSTWRGSFSMACAKGSGRGIRLLGRKCFEVIS